jgi:copper chaperone
VSGEPILGSRVILGVRGMDTDDARELVREAVVAVPGVLAVEPAGPQQFLVQYDAGETTVMEMIRAARRLGFLAGMA